MISTTRMRRRVVWLLATAVLLLALALSACGGPGGRNGGEGNSGGNGTGSATTQTTGNGGNGDNPAFNAAVNQVSGADAQIQAALGALDSAQNDANQDSSSQDNVIQP
jgi:hypothetical protein